MMVHAESMWDEMFGYRTKRPVNSGSMFWMFSDPWPTGSWSVVDWYGLPKASYYAAKRAARPLQIGWKNRADESGWELVACNDTLVAYEGTLAFGEETLSGESKWNKELAVSVPANSSTVLTEVDASEFSGAADVFLYAELVCGDESRNDIFFPNFWKEVSWPEPHLEIVEVKCLDEGLLEVSIKAGNFARCVHLEGINEGCVDGVAVTVGDAYFDLRAGETRTVRLESPAPIETQKLRVAHWLTEWA
jgi:beta-mannosidase